MSTSDRTSGETPEAAPPSLSAPSAPEKATAPGLREGESKSSRWSAVKYRKGLIFGSVLIAALAAIHYYRQSQSVVTTDDAYVNGHVTYVAPRVPGEIKTVLVDDNNRVHKGDVVAQIDSEPYQVQVNITQAAVNAAQTELVAAQAQARGLAGQVRSLRFSLQHAIEDVNNNVAMLHAKVAALQSQKASLAKARADYDRASALVKSATMSKEDFDVRKETLQVAQAKLEEALQDVNQIRVSLGLPPKTDSDADLASVPADLGETFSSVRQAQMSLVQAAAQIGLTDSFTKSPSQMIADFLKRDPQGDIDRIYANILKDAPAVKQAEARLMQAQRNLDEAQLNLRYCDVVAEIDGVVTRRNVNPGNYVNVGQSLMTIRSLTEIWVDANFKETQIAKLRIGQAVDLDVDMYGSRQPFKGRVSGFTMGTGSTLALLPAQNATGNFVKVVQRLPVRIEVLDYDPDKEPLFIGLSVTPRVYLSIAPQGVDAGKMLQLYQQPSAASSATTPR